MLTPYYHVNAIQIFNPKGITEQTHVKFVTMLINFMQHILSAYLCKELIINTFTNNAQLRCK